MFLNKLFSSKSKVVTRFAPSPTGLLHAGSYRTAVFSYLYAKQNKGKFILRIEDTDKVRSTKEFEKNITESLEWLELAHDEFYRQSERTEIYTKWLSRLIKEDKAYVSDERNSQNSERKMAEGEVVRDSVIRFRNLNKKVKFHDVIRGDIEFDTTELGDFIIAKSLTEPIFHFVVVLDDFLMGITHVIRGEDHISNTPRQILIQEALGAPTPLYAHLPLVLAPDRSKLSKRKGALAMSEYKEKGFLPQALLNYMTLIGWNPGTEKEIFTLDELIREFSLDKVQKGGAIFDEKKLRFINKEHLKKIDQASRVKILKEKLENSGKFKSLDIELINRIAPISFERVEVLKDIDDLIAAGDFDYYFAEPSYEIEKLLWKDDRDFGVTKNHLEEVKKLLENIELFPSEEKVKSTVWNYAEEKGRGNVLWPLRYALSGKDKSPNPFALIHVLGKETSLKRINNAITSLNK